MPRSRTSRPFRRNRGGWRPRRRFIERCRGGGSVPTGGTGSAQRGVPGSGRPEKLLMRSGIEGPARGCTVPIPARVPNPGRAGEHRLDAEGLLPPEMRGRLAGRFPRGRRGPAVKLRGLELRPAVESLTHSRAPGLDAYHRSGPGPDRKRSARRTARREEQRFRRPFDTGWNETTDSGADRIPPPRSVKSSVTRICSGCRTTCRSPSRSRNSRGWDGRLRCGESRSPSPLYSPAHIAQPAEFGFPRANPPLLDTRAGPGMSVTRHWGPRWIRVTPRPNPSHRLPGLLFRPWEF